MNHKRIMLDYEVQARRRWRAKRFWVRPLLYAAGRLQFGHYDQLIRALSLDGRQLFIFKFSYMRMEPLMLDKIFNRVGPRIQKERDQL